MNKNILTVSIFSLLMTFTGIDAKAQTSPAEQISEYITSEMSFLTMTADQSQQIYQINLQSALALEDLDKKRAGLSTSQADNMKDFVQILKDRNAALYKVLSPAQYDLFYEDKIARAATFRTFIMFQMLDLTQDQMETVFNINRKVVEGIRPELDAYFSAGNNRGRKKAQRKLQKSLKNADQVFDQVLSPQQIKIYHENADFLRKAIREDYGTN